MNELRRLIEAEIHERGPIPFSRYMGLCLYHPELGYYSRNAAQLARREIFIPRAIFMRSSGACLRASSTRCGAYSALRNES